MGLDERGQAGVATSMRDEAMEHLSLEIGKMNHVVMGSPGGGKNKHHSPSLEGSASSRSVVIPGMGNGEAVQNHRRQEISGFIDEGLVLLMGGAERTIDWLRAELIRAGQSHGGPRF